jgi:beta-ribofuranosylaminobenzene 5'-phosphate synthase
LVSDVQPVTIRSGSRIHLGLLDLGRVTARTFGGLGFMIDKPVVEAVATPNDSVEVVVPSWLHPGTKNYLITRIQRLVEEFPGSAARIELRTDAAEHVGFGSKTSMTLVSLTAIARATDRAIDKSELQRLSGRGGASGVGIHGFFTGGFIVDSGRLGMFPFLPSSMLEPTAIPTPLLTTRIPKNWKITLVLPPGERPAGQTEASFFTRVTPIPRSEILEQFALIYHGIVPAVLEGDLETFGDALHQFSGLGFKAREISEQGTAVLTTIAALREVAPCVGMSSMGPLVFAITRDSILERLPRLPIGTCVIGEASGAETGFGISYG